MFFKNTRNMLGLYFSFFTQLSHLAESIKKKKKKSGFSCHRHRTNNEQSKQSDYKQPRGRKQFSRAAQMNCHKQGEQSQTKH